eukprot:TRINITY_DN988_c0_g1_i10.p1 TRINITY_DN988_c0_g1~~TRINITY_DN988_c0_g1_i10.p1  ORF type:complete len:131 (+),score=23.03 TRINITY_DN988_c0_g1_i10:110-502(+)
MHRPTERIPDPAAIGQRAGKKKTRAATLSRVFDRFDFDKNGEIDLHELLQLNMVRQPDGWTREEWLDTERLFRRLLRRLETDEDGVSREEFCRYFEGGLPLHPHELLHGSPCIMGEEHDRCQQSMQRKDA